MVFHHVSEKGLIVGVDVQGRLKTGDDVLVHLIEVVLDELISSLVRFELTMAKWASEQFLAIHTDVVKFAWVVGQIV
jgi:hypothetical protein